MPSRKRFILAAVIAAFMGALALLAPQRAAAGLPSDFTLGPGGKITILVDEDSTLAGCLDQDSSECDGYSIKIPFQINGASDLSTDLSIGTYSITILIGAGGAMCPNGRVQFEAFFPVSSLKFIQTRTSESARFSGIAHGESVQAIVMVPTSFKLKADRKTGIGTLTMKGLGQGLGALNGATVDFLLSIHDFADDSDDDVSCVTVPATFRTSR
jgi:hypothetical protein